MELLQCYTKILHGAYQPDVNTANLLIVSDPVFKFEYFFYFM